MRQFPGSAPRSLTGIERDGVGVILVHMIDGALRLRHDRRRCAFWQKYLSRRHSFDPAKPCHGMNFLRFQAPEGEIRKIEVGPGCRMMMGIARRHIRRFEPFELSHDGDPGPGQRIALGREFR